MFYLLNNTVITRLLVQSGFTEVDHHIREEAIEGGEDEEEADDDHDEPGQDRRLLVGCRLYTEVKECWCTIISDSWDQHRPGSTTPHCTPPSPISHQPQTG